ncbi:MAG: ABC transporter ATP-binding protein [Candidatus Muiribacteriota bacterium]
MNYIKLENVSKSFVIWDKSLRSAFKSKQHKQVLNNINFEARDGEIIGFIGPNGSGKTTLLKIISGLLIPDGGKVDIKGKISPMLDIGIGFHPDLTGVENIKLFSSISSGIEPSDDDIKKITDFAGLTSESINSKYKFYSSGMKVRLGFSTIAFIKPDIVILDEITSVGDINFQTKAREKIDELSKNSKIMMVVSHDVNFVKSIATRAVAVINGSIAFDDKPEVVGYEYLKYMEEHKNDKI